MPLYVWSQVYGESVLVGATDVRDGGGEFRYAPSYVEARRHALDPINLPVQEAPAFTRANAGLFGVLHDAGPDGWGRRVLKNLYPARMANAGPLELLEMVQGRGIGALLFSAAREIAPQRPPPIGLSALGAAAEGAHQVEMDEPVRASVKDILAFGTSLGGLHPKIAVVDDDGVHLIVKFRSREDIIDTPRVEYACMRLALECGIEAAPVRQVFVAERAALLVQRFDRVDARLLHYASAHALWNRATVRADGADWSSYAGMAALRRQLPGAGVAADAAELFRRMVFNVIVGNTDDHGRNHGFLMDAAGHWRLAPAFDVLPTVGAAPGAQALWVGPQGRTRSIENCLAGANHFGLDGRQAQRIVEDVRACVARRWAALLAEVHCTNADIEAVLARVLH
ncbi:MAG TPA: type II toxin-antitoxin system HipA family toxin [Candidatus Binatia bacterium]|nr:type II toxin-antitoxin system HipA family toxin [Candidatus Binatia bacterium]